MQETSTRHTDSTVFPMSYYAENKLGFIITNSALSINRAPKLGETVTVETAPCSFKGMIAQRFYRMSDAEGHIIAESYTHWVLIDLSNRKPIRIPAELARSYGAVHICDGYKDTVIPEPGEGPVINTERFRASRRDADSNMHVNNIAYIAWAEDYVPEEVFGKKRVKIIKARYRKECLAGEAVDAQTRLEGDSAYLSRFTGGDGAVMAEVYSLWI
jgi:medium-chain acyl-[acyl-carrier-protein] hydrolase